MTSGLDRPGVEINALEALRETIAEIDADKDSFGQPARNNSRAAAWLSEYGRDLAYEQYERGDSLGGLRHPNSARFHEILGELADLHDRKQQDYGRGDDPFANVRATEQWDVPAWVGALIRLNDKVARLQSLVQKGYLANEAAEDSMRDIAVYAIIALVLYEEERDDTGMGAS